MNELQIFNYNDNEIRTIEKEDGIWWVLTDVCKVLDVKNATDVAKRLDGDEVTRFNLGGLSGESWIINESGLYNVILRSDKPEAVPFRRWVTHDVLPSIRKHGAYISDKSKQMAIEAKHMNARARVAAQWTKIAGQVNIPEFKQICASYASEALAGVPVLPLPTSGERHYKAGEIGDMFGVTSQRIGLIANANGLKTDEYGKWYHDKSPHSIKEVDSFRYNSKAIEKFKEILGN
jgi:prophage antirepressor-like protein